MNQLSAVLLSLVMAFSVTAPTLAVPSTDYAVLNVRYAPSGTPVNSTQSDPIEYRVYKIADAAASAGGSYTYTLTEDFQQSEIDINEIMGGRQLTEGQASDAQRNFNLLSVFGTYINTRQDQGQALEPYARSETARRAVGAGKRQEDGIAQFTGLEDGLYLVTSSAARWVNGTQYTPVPFIVNIPYRDASGVVGNYLTANVKFVTYTPSGGGGDPTPIPPTPVTPTPPTPTVDPEDPSIEILPDDVPLVDGPVEEPEIEIPEEEVPLAKLPQTGLLWWPVPVMAAAGIVLVIFGIVTKKRANRNG